MTSNFEFTDKAQESLASAIQLARDDHNAQVHPAHLASALISEGGGHAQGAQPQHQQHSIFAGAMQKAGGDTAAVQRAIQKLIVRLPAHEPAPEETSIGPAMQRLLREAQSLQKSMHDSYIAQDHLLLVLLKDPNMADVFKSCALSETALKSAIEQMRGNKRVDSKSAESGFDALNKYAQDLTALAEEGKLDPVIGRDNEIRRVIRVLSRRTKNNPVLIGEPGVGKTAIAEGLAQRIVKRDVPASLICRLFSVDMGALMAGAKYKGEYEERVKSLLDKVDKSAEQGTPVILFIDEMHLLMAGRGGEGGGMDAANLFKPLLARGKLRCIGATTLAEYRKYIETDQGLERRFAPVIVNEPSVPETLSILRGLREKYELFHAVRIMDGSLVQAATLAKRYLMARRLPDAAIDLVDEACASVRVTRETAPEAIDKLERRKLELDIEIYALEREKDSASKDRLVAARKARADLDEQLRPLKAAYEAEKKRTDEIANVRRRIEEPKAKADDAAARCGGEGEAAQDGEDHQRLGRRPARGGQGRDERHPPLALGSEEFWTAHCQLPHGWIEWYRQDTHEQNCSTPIPSPALGFALDAQPVAAPPSHFRDTQNDVTEIGTQDNTVALNELDPALDVFGDEDGVADAHRHELLSVACSGGDWAEDLRGDAIATATGSPRRDDAFARCPAREGELAAGARHGGETTHAVCRHARDDALRFALNGFAPAIDGFDDEELVGDARRRELVAGASHGGAAEPDGEQHVH